MKLTVLAFQMTFHKNISYLFLNVYQTTECIFINEEKLAIFINQHPPRLINALKISLQ